MGSKCSFEHFWGQNVILEKFLGQNTILENFWVQNEKSWGIFMIKTLFQKKWGLKHDFGKNYAIKTWFWETLWELKCKYARFMDQNANMKKSHSMQIWGNMDQNASIKNMNDM